MNSFLKLFSLSILISFTAFDLAAQDSEFNSDFEFGTKRDLDSGVDIAFRVGFNLSTIFRDYKNINFQGDIKRNPGFHFGPLVKFPIIKNRLAFETGAIFSSKGYGLGAILTQYGVRGEYRFNFYYLEIPLNFHTRWMIKRTHFLGLTYGPYIGLGIIGSQIELRDRDTQKLSFGDDSTENIFKRMDFGLNIGIEYQKRPFRIGVFYDYGLVNVDSASDRGRISKNRNLRLSVAFIFRK